MVVLRHRILHVLELCIRIPVVKRDPRHVVHAGGFPPLFDTLMQTCPDISETRDVPELDRCCALRDWVTVFVVLTWE